MDDIVSNLPEVDVISIVDKNNVRLYHTNHFLINTMYDGTLPDFYSHPGGFYTENNIGPSGPQRRTYSAVYDEKGNYDGFILTVRLKTSMVTASIRSMSLFITVTLAAILIEIAIFVIVFAHTKGSFFGIIIMSKGNDRKDKRHGNNHS